MYFRWLPASAGAGAAIDFIEPDYTLTNKWDLGVIPMNHESVAAPYVDGEQYLDSTLFQPRSLRLEVLMRADDRDSLFTLQRTLGRAFNPKFGIGQLQMVQTGITFGLDCLVRTTPTFVTGESRGEIWQVAAIDLIAFDPCWYNIVEQTPTLKTFYGGLKFPFSFPFNVGSAQQTLTCTNNGDTATPIYAVFHGDITNPRLDNITTGKFIKATMNLALQDTLVINTTPGRHSCRYVTAAGVDNNGFPYISSDSEFFMLEPGDNTITFSASTSIGDQAYCSIVFYDRYSVV